MNDLVTFGIIGCGHIGKRHAAVISDNPEATVVALSDSDQSSLNSLGEKYGVADLFANYEELLDKEMQVVSVCTPHHLHKSMSIDAMERGKHVLVEKPMAISSADAHEMIAKSKELGVKLFVVKQNRYNVPVILTTKAINEGALGRIFFVECNVFWNRNQAYYDQSEWRGDKEKEGGALFTQASHFVDLLVHWFGALDTATGLLATQHHKIEVEDCGQASLMFESGIMGSISWTTNVYNKNYEGSITIIGEYGTVKIGGPYLNKIEFWDVQSYPLPDNISFVDTPNTYGMYEGSSSNHHRVIEEVVNNINGKESNIVEGPEGELSIAAIEKIYSSLK